MGKRTGRQRIERHKSTLLSRYGCQYQGYEFGASYLDSICLDGYLWDADSGNADGERWIYTNGGDIPCPKCNAKEHREYYADNDAEEISNG